LVSKQDRGDIQAICKSLGYAPEEVPLPKTVEKKSDQKSNGKGKKSNGKRSGRSRGKGRGKGRGKPSKSKRANKQKGSRKLHGLPRPTFDQLEGGRTGKKKEEKKGLVGFIKKLFS
jgi:hypothetical protein